MNLKIIIAIVSISSALLFSACTTSRVSPEAEARLSHDGLEPVTGKTSADAVYVRPGVDLSRYDKVMLEEPDIAFRANWQQDFNFGDPTRRLSNKDVEKMIVEGKKLFLEEFSQGLEKGGITIVDEPGDDVLLVKPSLIDLYITAPDPNNQSGIWNEVYARSFGDMALFIELYDSVSHQILVRAQDQQRDIGEGAGSWRFPRNQAINRADARMAFSQWARMFVKGFDRAKEAAVAE
jgi:hypothetical protein